jgi:hypothetical protein
MILFAGPLYLHYLDGIFVIYRGTSLIDPAETWVVLKFFLFQILNTGCLTWKILFGFEIMLW